MLDVSAYLQRIEYHGSTKPSAKNLRALHRAHLLTVPFENLDIHLKRTIILNEALLYDKIVRKQRGGFCYELNGMLAWLLRALGFEVTLFSANVLHGGIADGIDHMTLLVTLDDPWIVDVGFGDSSRLPLRLVEGDGQFGVGQEYCLTRDAGRWTLWRKEEYDGWYAEYAFQIDPLELSDFQCACDYYQFTPGTYFVEGRICSRATPHGRITLTDDKLIVTRYGQRDEMPVQDEQAFLAALQEHMGIRLRSMDDPHYHPT